MYVKQFKSMIPNVHLKWEVYIQIEMSDKGAKGSFCDSMSQNDLAVLITSKARAIASISNFTNKHWYIN